MNWKKQQPMNTFILKEGLLKSHHVSSIHIYSTMDLWCEHFFFHNKRTTYKMCWSMCHGEHSNSIYFTGVFPDQPVLPGPPVSGTGGLYPPPPPSSASWRGTADSPVPRDREVRGHDEHSPFSQNWTSWQKCVCEGACVCVLGIATNDCFHSRLI